MKHSHTTAAWLMVTAAGLAGCGLRPYRFGDDDVFVATPDGEGPDAGDSALRDAPSDARDGATDVPNDYGADVPLVDAADVPDSGPPPCVPTQALVVTTDGTVSQFLRASLRTAELRVVPRPADSDAPAFQAVRMSRCRAFGLWLTVGAGGLGAVVQLDLADPYRPVWRMPMPPVATRIGTLAATPSDVVVVAPTRAYVLQYNSPQVVVFDPTRDGPSARTGVIDLSAFADDDGMPEAIAVTVVGPRAYIALQRLHQPERTPIAGVRSQIVAVDIATDTIVDLDGTVAGVQGIDLTYNTPTARFAVSPDGHHLLVASIGNYLVPGSGGLDVIDLRTSRVAYSLSGAPGQLDGTPTSVVALDNATAWVAVRSATAGAGTAIWTVDYASHSATPSFASPRVLADLQRAPDGRVWAIDGSPARTGAVFLLNTTGTVTVVGGETFPSTTSIDLVP